MENLYTYIMMIPALIGAASMVVAGMEKFASITPTTKDDEYVSKIKKELSKLVAFIDKFTLNRKV